MDWKLMVWCVIQALAITIAGTIILLGIAEMAETADDVSQAELVRQFGDEFRRSMQSAIDRNAFLAIAERYGITAAGAYARALHQREEDSYHAFAAGLHLLQNQVLLYQRRQAPDAACERDFRT